MIMIAQTLKWVGGVGGFLELTDQRLLPDELVKLRCSDIEQVYEAIRSLAVRGAPAIGVTAAYGLVLGLQKLSQITVTSMPACCSSHAVNLAPCNKGLVSSA